MTEGFTVSDFMEAAQESADIKEKVYGKIVDFAFDDKKLQYFARLKGDRIEYIIKNFILVDFYQEFYSKAGVEIILKRTCKPPFYEKTVRYKTQNTKVKKSLLQKYPELINKLMRLTISQDGLGRKEAFGLLESMNREIDRKMGLRDMIRLK